MLLRVFQFSSRIRIYVACATKNKESEHPGMVLFQRGLGISGIVSVHLVKIAAERRIVTRITKENAAQISLLSLDAQHRNLMVHRTRIIGSDGDSFGRSNAAIYSESR